MKAKPEISHESLGPLPRAIVEHLTTARGPRTSHLLVDGQPQIRQDGWTLALEEISDSDEGGHITAVEISLLTSGALLTSITSVSEHGESHTAHIDATPADAAEWLMRHCHGHLEAPARAAWRQACEVLPALLVTRDKD
jgi:hypothetical protein